MRKTLPIEKIKAELINSCLNYNAKSFIPFLLSENVLTGMPNKIRFYRFLKRMLICTKENSKGQLVARIENKNENNSRKKYYLNFYDKIHKHSRLTIEIKETKNSIYLDTLPF